MAEQTETQNGGTMLPSLRCASLFSVQKPHLLRVPGGMYELAPMLLVGPPCAAVHAGKFFALA